MAVFANIGGWIADTLVSKGFSITTVRKASPKSSVLNIAMSYNTTLIGFSFSPYHVANLEFTDCLKLSFSSRVIILYDLRLNIADNAVYWVSRPRLFPYTAEPCKDTRHGSSMHGLQSGTLTIS